MNLECAVTVEMLDIACEVRPHDACLVPEARGGTCARIAATSSMRMCKLRPLLKTRMNLECAVTVEMLDIACECVRDACLVPEARGADDRRRSRCRRPLRGRACGKQLADVGVRASLFIDPDETQIRAARRRAGDRAAYGPLRGSDEAEQQREYERIVAGVQAGAQLGLKVNAGHGLHYERAADRRDRRHRRTEHRPRDRRARDFAGWDNAVRRRQSWSPHACRAAWRRALDDMPPRVARHARPGRVVPRTDMAIYGIGTDIAQVSRIAAVLAHGRPVCRRCWTSCACSMRAAPLRARIALATRFPRRKRSRRRSAACTGR